MENGITKKERDYILFNIRGFFRHYKIEQNINKISVDISNLQAMAKEVNKLISDINEYSLELTSNSKILNDNNKENKTRLLVNRRHKMTTKSTDTATKKIVENKQKIKLNDLNKSNLTLRPKTPDVSKIFNKYKKKKYNTNRNSSKKIYINNNNYNTIGSNSFVQTNNFLNKYNDNNSIIKTNNLINQSNYNLCSNRNSNNYNRTQYKYKNKKDNSFDNKEKDFHTLNYTMTKFPNEYKNIKNKNINKLNLNDKLKTNDLSPNKINNTKNNKNENINKSNENNLNNIKKFDNNNINNIAFKTKKFKKMTIRNKYLNERFHSYDIIKKKGINESKNNQNLNINQNNKNNIVKKVNKKTFNFRKRNNVKTPSPLYYRQSSPLLIDHDTIIRNKNKKINYNGNYYNEKKIQKKISNSNINKKKNNYYFKKKSNDKINKNQKDITKEEEKKLDEQIINSTINNAEKDIIQNDIQINNTKNILDLSQNILQNLEYMNNMEINKSDTNSNIMNLTEINNNNNNSNKNLEFELLKKNSDNLFKSNYIESLYLSIKLGFFEPWEKLKILLISKELNFKFKIKDIIIEYINYYEKQILIINNKIKKYEINKINKPFTPRKTGLNSLNFITKNEQQRLINEQQHEYVINIFKIILILLNEYNSYNLKENEIENNNGNENHSKIFEYFFNEVYKKNNVNNIKDLFINNFVDKIPLISDEQFNMINDIIKEIPELLSPSTLLAYNRNVSYLTFFLSELYNYFANKTNDGDIFYYKIRNEYSKINEYINKINKLKIYL